MASTPKPVASMSRSLPPIPVEQSSSHRFIRLDDVRKAPALTPDASYLHRQPISPLQDFSGALSRYKRGARTISTIKASYVASTSLERSDNHRAIIHHKDSLSLRERYIHGHQALQKIPAGSEFVVMWDAWDKLKKVIARALNRRVRKNAVARKANQTVPPQPEPLNDRPLFKYPTPIYEAHRKHRSKPAPKEFYQALAAVRGRPRTPSPPPLPTIKRKPAPGTVFRGAPNLLTAASEQPRALRRSQHITLDRVSTPRTSSHSKTDRSTRVSDLMRPRVQSNIFTGSDKQSRLCDVCGTVSSAATGGRFSKEKLWLCAECQSSDGSSGELPPLSPMLIQRHQLQPSKARTAWDPPVGNDLVWNCEHCFASFSSAPPASGNLCICPMCKREIAAHPTAVSRKASQASQSSRTSRPPSSLFTRGNEQSHFSQATEASDMVSAAGGNRFSRASSIYRASRYEKSSVPTHDPPVSPIGQGKFDAVDYSTIHPAFRPLPPTPGLPRAPSKERPDKEWRNSRSTPVPGIDKARSYQTGPVTHLAYEFPSSSEAPSAATTAMDLSLPLMPRPPAPTPTAAYFESKTEQRQLAQYQKLRGFKHMASSIYPEDQEERRYRDNRDKKPLPEMPKREVGEAAILSMNPQFGE